MRTGGGDKGGWGGERPGEPTSGVGTWGPSLASLSLELLSDSLSEPELLSDSLGLLESSPLDSSAPSLWLLGEKGRSLC